MGPGGNFHNCNTKSVTSGRPSVNGALVSIAIILVVLSNQTCIESALLAGVIIVAVIIIRTMVGRA